MSAEQLRREVRRADREGKKLSDLQRRAIAAIGRRKNQPFIGSEMFPVARQRGTKIRP